MSQVRSGPYVYVTMENLPLVTRTVTFTVEVAVTRSTICRNFSNKLRATGVCWW